MSNKFGKITDMRVKKRKTGLLINEEDEPKPLVASDGGEVMAIPYRGPLRLLGVEGGFHPNRSDMFLKVIRGGLPRYSLDKLMEVTGFTIYEMADILDTTDRTLRRHDGNVKLSREHSERALEIAQLYHRGEDVFGDMDAFRQWMDAKVPALGGLKPRSFLDTSLGIQLLLSELVRIEHGVFA